MSESQRPQSGKGILLYKKWRDLENEQKKQILREAEALFQNAIGPSASPPSLYKKQRIVRKTYTAAYNRGILLPFAEVSRVISKRMIGWSSRYCKKKALDQCKKIKKRPS